MVVGWLKTVSLENIAGVLKHRTWVRQPGRTSRCTSQPMFGSNSVQIVPKTSSRKTVQWTAVWFPIAAVVRCVFVVENVTATRRNCQQGKKKVTTSVYHPHSVFKLTAATLMSQIPCPNKLFLFNHGNWVNVPFVVSTIPSFRSTTIEYRMQSIWGNIRSLSYKCLLCACRRWTLLQMLLKLSWQREGLRQ